ncbi:DUF4232 domain-containing protein [Streptomyces sp. 7R007]
MTDTSLSVHRAALLVSAVAVLGVLTACGGSGDGAAASSPTTLPGTAAPATGDTATAPATATDSATASAPASAPGETTASATATRTATGRTSTRCHTSELRASVGRNNPGAGQENFPIVLTNTSSRTCTVRGYPGAAYVDASGHQLGADPQRTPGTPTTVTLAPGRSAWAGLSFSNPEVSGARPATPASLLVTPPDERDPLTVKWTGGPVPVSGNESSSHLTVFSPGTGV